MHANQSRLALFNTARARLFVLVLLVIVPALGVQVFGAWSDLQKNLLDRRFESVRVIQHAQSDFDSLLVETRAVFTDLVRVNDMRSANNCTRVFTSLRFALERLAPEITNLGLADADGNIYCAVNPVQGTKNLSAQVDFLTAKETLDMSLGSYALGTVNALPVLSVSYPVLSFDGEIQTVIFATLGTRWLRNWQNEVPLPEGAAVTLLAPDGGALWRLVNGETVPVLPLSGQEAAWLPALRGGEAVVETPDFDGAIRLNTMIPLKMGIQTAAYLHLGYPVAELYYEAYQSLFWKLGLLGIVLAAALGVAWWGSETMFLNPLKNLLGVVERVQAGDLGARVSKVPRLGELAVLAQSFDRMADSLQQREQEGRQSEARFRAAFESSAIGVGVMTLEGKILAANAAVCKMSGYTEEELKQRYDSENVYPPDAQVGLDLFVEMLAGKRDYFGIEKRYIRKNGEVFWTRLTLSLVRSADGEPSYLVGMIEDIDQKKRMLAELQVSEARFRAMFDNTAVGVALMSLDRHILQINPTVTRITGYSPEEMLATNPSHLVVEEDRYLDADLYQELVAGTRDQYLMEKRYIRKDGSLFWGRVNFALVRDVDKTPMYIVGIIEDINEEKSAAERLAAQEAQHFRLLERRIAERTEELNLANERLREKAAQDAVAAERTRLARDLHDAVTQTLFSTTLIADVLPAIWEINPPEAKRRLEELRQLTRGALAEMRTLLVELRPNALIEVPLPTLLRQLTEALTGRARIDIQLSVEGECKLPADVQVGLYRMAQEALNNVIKHARASQVVVTLRAGNGVRLTVADNGEGFDPTTVTGDHLGLKIMRERTEAIGAKLSVYSEPGEGTQISVVWE